MGPTENEAQRATDLAILAIGLVCAAQFDEAEPLLWQALRLGEHTENAWVQNNCLTFLPFVFRQRGQVEELRRLLAQARSIGIAPHNRILSGHTAGVAWREGNLTLAETYGCESLQEERSLQIKPNPFLWTGSWPLIGVALTQEQTSAAINNVRLLFDPTQQPPREPLDTLLEAVLHAWIQEKRRWLTLSSCRRVLLRSRWAISKKALRLQEQTPAFVTARLLPLSR